MIWLVMVMGHSFLLTYLVSEVIGSFRASTPLFCWLRLAYELVY